MTTKSASFTTRITPTTLYLMTGNIPGLHSMQSLKKSVWAAFVSDNWTLLTLHKFCVYLRSSFALIELQHWRRRLYVFFPDDSLTLVDFLHMMPQFGRSLQELSLIANKVMDEIYETLGHLAYNHRSSMADKSWTKRNGWCGPWSRSCTSKLLGICWWHGKYQKNMFLYCNPLFLISCLSPHLFQS
mgnify:CR=1 FL=1